MGKIGLNRLRSRDRICSLYLFIGEPDAWGNGYGPDAVTALLSYMFDRLDLHMVELWTLAANEPAIRTYASCGFVVEATPRPLVQGRNVDGPRRHERHARGVRGGAVECDFLNPLRCNGFR